MNTLLSKTATVSSISTRFLSTSQYCIDSVKKYDYENFICTLLLKEKSRAYSFAVRAFNIEVARVQDQISDYKTGLMRLKFWQEVLDKCFSKEVVHIPEHPVARELHKVISATKLTRRHLHSLVTSREKMLSVRAFENLEAMEQYAESSVSSVYYLILEGSGIQNVHADHTASHLGKAQGLVQLLRSVPLTAKKGDIILPQDLLIKYNISHEQLKRGTSSDGLRECVFEVAGRANQHLEKARNLSPQVISEAKPIFLPASPVENYLNQLRLVDCDIFNNRLKHRNLLWLPKVWWKNLRNQF